MFKVNPISRLCRKSSLGLHIKLRSKILVIIQKVLFSGHTLANLNIFLVHDTLGIVKSKEYDLDPLLLSIWIKKKILKKSIRDLKFVPILLSFFLVLVIHSVGAEGKRCPGYVFFSLPYLG